MKQKYEEKKMSKPCGTCPFRKVNSELGGNTPEVYLGQQV